MSAYAKSWQISIWNLQVNRASSRQSRTDFGQYSSGDEDEDARDNVARPMPRLELWFDLAYSPHVPVSGRTSGADTNGKGDSDSSDKVEGS